LFHWYRATRGPDTCFGSDRDAADGDRDVRGVPTFGDDGEYPAGIGMEDGERPRLATLYARIDRWIVRRKLGQDFRLVNADQRPRRVGEVALPRLPRFPPPQPRIDRAGRSIRIPLPRRAVRSERGKENGPGSGPSFVEVVEVARIELASGSPLQSGLHA